MSAALSRIEFSRVSRQHPDFFSFVENTIVTNRKHRRDGLRSLQKEDWDARYSRALREVFPRDPLKVEEYIRQVKADPGKCYLRRLTRVLKARSHEGTKIWQDTVQRKLGHPDVPVSATWTEQCLALNLPSLSHPTKRSDREQFDGQTYSGFAESLRKRNQHVVLSKALVDEAFRLAASKISKRSPHRIHMEKMCDRVSELQK